MVTRTCLVLVSLLVKILSAKFVLSLDMDHTSEEISSIKDFFFFFSLETEFLVDLGLEQVRAKGFCWKWSKQLWKRLQI